MISSQNESNVWKGPIHRSCCKIALRNRSRSSLYHCHSSAVFNLSQVNSLEEQDRWLSGLKSSRTISDRVLRNSDSKASSRSTSQHTEVYAQTLPSLHSKTSSTLWKLNMCSGRPRKSARIQSPLLQLRKTGTLYSRASVRFQYASNRKHFVIGKPSQLLRGQASRWASHQA